MTNVAGRFALALHGGAGTLWRGEMTAEREAAYGVGLLRALAAGRDVLAAAGNAVTVTVWTTTPCSTQGVVACRSLGRPPLWAAATDHGRSATFTISLEGHHRHASAGIHKFCTTNRYRARKAAPQFLQRDCTARLPRTRRSKKPMILNVPPLPGALLRVSSRGQGTTTPRLAICSETETRRKASASRIVFERWAFRKS